MPRLMSRELRPRRARREEREHEAAGRELASPVVRTDDHVGSRRRIDGLEVVADLPEVLLDDDDVDAAALQFDRRAQTRRAAAEHHGLAAIDRQIDPADAQGLVRGARRHAPRQRDVGERIEDRLAQMRVHLGLPPKFGVDEIAMIG